VLLSLVLVLVLALALALVLVLVLVLVLLFTTPDCAWKGSVLCSRADYRFDA